MGGANDPAGGQFFWSPYLKSGTSPGSGNSYWPNFGSGWSHLTNDNPKAILTGSSQRLFYDVGHVTPHGAGGGTPAGSGDPAYNVGQWKLVIEATMFVTGAVLNVWTGTKPFSPDPTGDSTRIAGCDPTEMLTVAAQ
jgi:hypothetical protein